MVNGTNFVWNYLDRNTDIKRDIGRGIINLRSLAKFIMQENPSLGLSISGTVIAVRRYTEEKKFQTKHSAMDKIFSNTKLKMSLGKIILHINKTEHSISALMELFKKLNLVGEESVNLVMDKHSFALYFDSEYHDLIRNQFTQDKIITEIDDVGQIIMKFDPAVLETPNVFATILNELGINDINVVDSISKRERFLVFLHEKDLMNACNIVYKYTKPGRKVKQVVINN
jgi:hypothetical protein